MGKSSTADSINHSAITWQSGSLLQALEIRWYVVLHDEEKKGDMEKIERKWRDDRAITKDTKQWRRHKMSVSWWDKIKGVEA